ncbi:right-handed parallel beta-helix repeat-containing protein [Leptospira yasudae]|uniref:right-handed parallel beta-helix repeat-containing protein n=1 Tax=Leptospira yasudae TaxID=2202201 RepID=UPI001091606D|nr:right-handed parallel beta-helix repeat-containing protein [Leptospira yasudae]TGM96927.1 right-handed parallel beta-helix repeat-containing protein [Leptospira yasudae]
MKVTKNLYSSYLGIFCICILLLISCNHSSGNHSPIFNLFQDVEKIPDITLVENTNTIIGPIQLLYVSNSLGNDSNNGLFPDPDGSGNGPFRSIERAISKVREIRINQSQMNLYSPIKIAIREGTYFVNEPLTIDSSLSGKNANTALTITRYMNEHPIISGGRPVINWVLTNPSGSPKIWVADYPDNNVALDTLPGKPNDEETDLLHNFWVDGKWAVKARYPKNDSYYSSPEQDQSQFWMFADSRTYSDGQPYAALIDSDPAENLSYAHVGYDEWNNVKNWDLRNSEIVIYLNDYSRLSYRLKGVVYDPASSTIGGYYLFENPANDAAYSSYGFYTRFFVSNVLQQLQNEGEWYLDKINRKIYYIARGNTNPNLSQTTVSGLTSIMNITGNGNQTVDFIIIDGLLFSGTAGTFAQNSNYHHDAAIHIKWGNKISIINSFFNNISGSGIHIDEGSRWITVMRNTFADLGLSGVLINSISGLNSPFQNVIQGNYIIRSGLIGSMAGILIIASDDNSVFDNQVDRSNGHGIAVVSKGSSNSDTSTINGITGNEVYYSALGTADQGGIYVHAQNDNDGKQLKPTENWITENRVLQSLGATRGKNSVKDVLREGADGIFLDDCSSGNLVYLNVVSNATRSTIHINGGGTNRIYQNILSNGREAMVMTNKELPFYINQSNEFYLNFIVNLDPAYTSENIWMMINKQSPKSSFSWIDGNLYWRSFDNIWAYTDTTFSQLGTYWYNWRQSGLDTNSIFTVENPGLQISSGTVAYGNAAGGWTSSVGYGPGSGLLTGLRRFAAASNDPATACINAFFGSQYSPIFNVDPKLFYTTCIVP